jgi:hypothetical protein
MRMKKIQLLVACGVLASFAVAGSAQAAWHHPPHHPVCKWVFEHHHKVRRCH